MKIVFAPSNIQTEVYNIEGNIEEILEAIAGDNVSFNVKKVFWKDIRRGYVCGDQINDPPKEVQSFVAQIVIRN